MDLELIRTSFTVDGIFGVLLDPRSKKIAVTLEHAYPQGLTYLPKLPAGEYQCVRGEHTLEKHPQPFETFEITGVRGHSDILFHVGNYNADSAGCVLVGTYRAESGPRQLYDSRETFQNLMKLQEGVDQFTLKVTNVC